MSAEANRTALQVIRKILAAAHPFELTVGDEPVSVTVTGQEAQPWPVAIDGLDPERDGPWPPEVHVRCDWQGGQVSFALVAFPGRHKTGRGVIALRLLPGRKFLGFSNVGPTLAGTDEPQVPIRAWFNLKKRSKGPTQNARNEKLRKIVSASGLPMLTDWAVELSTVRVEDAAVLPSPEVAFERFIHLNLIKLDFFSRGPRALERGKPLFDLDALGLGDGDDDEEEGTEDEETEEPGHWVASCATPERLARCAEEGAWELGLPKDGEDRASRLAWSHFDEIGVGDRFALKLDGDGPRIAVQYFGEVTAVDPEAGRVELERLREPLPFEDAVPRGQGVGTWADPLIAVRSPEVIDAIFRRSEDAPSSEGWTGPRNLILYGPPGTGKTYRLRRDYLPKLSRQTGDDGFDVESVADLSWFEVVAAAMAQSGGESTPMKLRDHPWVKAKYQAKPHKAPIGSRIWPALQRHTVERSTTVGYAKRTGRLVFDKREDGTWFFPDGVPEDIADLARSLGRTPTDTSESFVFVTFHQSYAYEDFIEGIRPKTLDGDDDAGPSLTYELEDGVFLRAANAALRLTGFDGTVDDVCRLPIAERRALFANEPPPYAVFIDEINRGNVSRIFGELITLIEEDKRLGADGEIIVTLPYSRRRFGVPPNLCLVGTMNTADRSVEALDSALRRRFSFLECAPDPSVLGPTIVAGEVDVARMLRTINERLELLLDRDHLIGHAHLLPLAADPTIARLKEVFAMSILPLLAEYFYADLGRVGLVLGRPFVQPVSHKVSLAPFDHEAGEQLAERRAYRFTPTADLTTEHFKSIYEPPRA